MNVSMTSFTWLPAGLLCEYSFYLVEIGDDTSSGVRIHDLVLNNTCPYLKPYRHVLNVLCCGKVLK